MATPNETQRIVAELKKNLKPQEGQANTSTATRHGVPPLVESYWKDGKQEWNYHFHEGQQAAWNSKKRIVAIISGVRSGKSSWSPIWLFREMVEHGPGDYLVVAPNFPLLEKAMLPEIENFFGHMRRMGKLIRSPSPAFIISAHGALQLGHKITPRPSRIIFCHATDPNTLAAMTAKAAVLDEAGQSDFRLGSWEQIQARLSIDQGRCLICTTPYQTGGWLKSKIFDQWKAYREKGQDHPEIDVINFASTMNPAFPEEEMDRARRDLPPWKFRMFFKGEFERPAGTIYDCFSRQRHITPRFAIPEAWPRHVGIDFGGVNTAAVFLAEEMDGNGQRTGRFFAYKTYRPNASRTAKHHAEAIIKGEPRIPHCYGGSGGEDQWRNEFHQAGLPVKRPALKELTNSHATIEVGINRVYALLQNDRLVFFGDLEDLIDEIENYAREVDDAGQTLEAIANRGDAHFCDATRYVCAEVSEASPARAIIIGGDDPTIKKLVAAQIAEQERQRTADAKKAQVERTEAEVHWLLDPKQEKYWHPMGPGQDDFFMTMD